MSKINKTKKKELKANGQKVNNGYIAENDEVAQKSALPRSDNFFIKAKMRYFFSIINIFTAKDKRKRIRHRKYDL